MGQREVIDWLMEKRKNGDKGFFTVNQIKQDIKHGKIHRDIKKLWAANTIEVESDFFRLRNYYRIKEEYYLRQVNNSKEK